MNLHQTELSIRNTGRIEWIDVVKGILILCVVFSHNIQYGSGARMLAEKLFFENKVFQYIYSFHMPCLMLISGYFFGFSVDKEKLWKHRIKTVLIPTLAWAFIPALLGLVKAVLTQRINAQVGLSFLRTMIEYYWFLWAILFCSALVWVVNRKMRDSVLVYMAIGAALLFAPDVLNTRMWIYMYPYFVTGYLFQRKPLYFGHFFSHKLAYSVLLICLHAALFVRYDTSSFIYTTGIMVRSFPQLFIDLYRFLIGFFGSAMVLWLGYILTPFLNDRVRSILAYCGRISLTIYILDCLLNSYVLPRITKGVCLHYGIVTVETVIIVAFCAIIDSDIKKVPIARKVLLGSR